MIRPSEGETKKEYVDRVLSTEVTKAISKEVAFNEATDIWEEVKKERYLTSIYREEVYEADYYELYESTFHDSDYRESMTTVHEVTIYKAKPADHMVFGWANVALDKDGNPPFEWQQDIIEPEELEKAAYDFMLNFREAGEEHLDVDKCVVSTIVESMMFTKEKMEALNIPEGIVPEGWWVGVKVEDEEVYKKVEDGTYKMFSIQGQSKRYKML